MCEVCVRTCNAIGELNSDEGSGVNILAGNPDLAGPSYVIEVTADWTHFQSTKFEGDSVVEALETAVVSKRNHGK